MRQAAELERMAREMRRAEVRRLRAEGLSFTEIGKRLGFSRQRAAQLFADVPPEKTA